MPGQRAQPIAETPLLRPVFEPANGPADLKQGLLRDFGRVRVLQAPAPAVPIDQRAVDAHEGFPGVRVARLANPHQQARARGRPGGMLPPRYIARQTWNLALFSCTTRLRATRIRLMTRTWW